MSVFVHGGDSYGLDKVIDFSASLSPLGMPPSVKKALVECVASFEAYPDPYCRDIRAALSQKMDIDPDWISITAGASDAFMRIALALQPSGICLCDPCYSGYEQALVGAGLSRAHRVRVPLCAQNNFAFDMSAFIDGLERLDALGRVDARGRADAFGRADARGRADVVNVAFLCTPNNPTGQILAPDDIRQVLDAAHETQTVVVLDECFVELAGISSLAPWCQDYPHLIVVRAFTKTYALAGLRLGYCICSDAALVQKLECAGAPWAVSAPAQVAGLAALQDMDYLQQACALVHKERTRVERALVQLGAQVIPSQANFILFKSHQGLDQQLRERGILIRCCDSFEGLDASWFRIGLRTPQDNTRFLEACKQVLVPNDAQCARELCEVSA